MTVVVGANNSGKSTIVEALRAAAQQQPPSFTQGRRNQLAGDQVSIRCVNGEDATVLKSIRPGSSETEKGQENNGVDLTRLLVLPARRVFNPYFGRSIASRADYMNQMGFPAIRTSALDQFTNRLFAIENNRDAFDKILKRIVDPVPDWSIDQMDSGQYFLKIKKGGAIHSSEGLGEGLVSLIYIIDALYDSQDGDTIAVDEPELSLHPALQRKLSDLLAEYATTRQLVLATHSPYFVGLDALSHGASVARTHLVDGNSQISQLSPQSGAAISEFLKNENNPHIFGLAAREIFFVDDGVILLEGQEDVVFFKRVEATVGSLSGTYFGWGIGGAENMDRIATVLTDLGFVKVVGILDGNRADAVTNLSNKFAKYHFFAIPADDIRTKKPAPAKPGVAGLLDDRNAAIRPEYIDQVRSLFERANKYLQLI